MTKLEQLQAEIASLKQEMKVLQQTSGAKHHSGIHQAHAHRPTTPPKYAGTTRNLEIMLRSVDLFALYHQETTNVPGQQFCCLFYTLWTRQMAYVF